jgi:hypothetical protein
MKGDKPQPPLHRREFAFSIVGITRQALTREPLMDGVEFFSAGLSSVAMELQPTSEGRCAIHNRPAMLYNFGGNLVCRGCVLLRQAYPIRGRNNQEGKTRLGLGSYMLITETKTEYWGKHIMPPQITVHPAAGALRDLIRNLILNPPPPPWMFVSFARSNAPDRLAITTTNNLLRFSGKFFLPGTKGQPQVDRLNRNRVIALHDAADLTRQEWEQVVRSHAALHSSPDALAYLREVYQQHPKLQNVPIPPERTPEYNAVRLIAKEA